MPSENPTLPVRFATEAEKSLMREIALLAGSPNFNAWVITLLRATGEEVLRTKAPDKLEAFFASRKKPKEPG